MITWRNEFEVVCDKNIPIGLKARVYRMLVRQALLYGAQYWPMKKIQVQRLIVAEMRTIL